MQNILLTDLIDDDVSMQGGNGNDFLKKQAASMLSGKKPTSQTPASSIIL